MLLEYCSMTTSKSIVFLIGPSLGYPCPAQQCMTLEQFAATIPHHSTAEAMIILKLSPDNHSLALEITIANIKKFSMSSENTNATVTCS